MHSKRPDVQSMLLPCSAESAGTETLAFVTIMISYETPKYALQHGLELGEFSISSLGDARTTEPPCSFTPVTANISPPGLRRAGTYSCPPGVCW